MSSPERPSKLAGLARQIRAAQQAGPAPEPESAVESSAPIAPPSREAALGAANDPPRGERHTPKRQRGAKQARADEPESPADVPKSRHADYVQVTMFLRRVHYAEAQNKLRTARTLHREKRDFSDVADALVAGWLAGRFKV